MSIEMVILVVLGIQTTLFMGVIGLVVMWGNSQLGQIRADLRETNKRIDSHHQHLVSLILQTRTTTEREPA